MCICGSQTELRMVNMFETNIGREKGTTNDKKKTKMKYKNTPFDKISPAAETNIIFISIWNAFVLL